MTFTLNIDQGDLVGDDFAATELLISTDRTVRSEIARISDTRPVSYSAGQGGSIAIQLAGLSSRITPARFNYVVQIGDRLFRFPAQPDGGTYSLSVTDEIDSPYATAADQASRVRRLELASGYVDDGDGSSPLDGFVGSHKVSLAADTTLSIEGGRPGYVLGIWLVPNGHTATIFGNTIELDAPGAVTLWRIGNEWKVLAGVASAVVPGGGDGGGDDGGNTGGGGTAPGGSGWTLYDLVDFHDIADGAVPHGTSTETTQLRHVTIDNSWDNDLSAAGGKIKAALAGDNSIGLTSMSFDKHPRVSIDFDLTEVNQSYPREVRILTRLSAGYLYVSVQNDYDSGGGVGSSDHLVKIASTYSGVPPFTGTLTGVPVSGRLMVEPDATAETVKVYIDGTLKLTIDTSAMEYAGYPNDLSSASYDHNPLVSFAGGAKIDNLKLEVSA